MTIDVAYIVRIDKNDSKKYFLSKDCKCIEGLRIKELGIFDNENDVKKEIAEYYSNTKMQEYDDVGYAASYDTYYLFLYGAHRKIF